MQTHTATPTYYQARPAKHLSIIYLLCHALLLPLAACLPFNVTWPAVTVAAVAALAETLDGIDSATLQKLR